MGSGGEGAKRKGTRGRNALTDGDPGNAKGPEAWASGELRVRIRLQAARVKSGGGIPLAPGAKTGVNGATKRRGNRGQLG